MKGCRLYLALLSGFSVVSAFPQVNCTVPLPPVLTSVSVQPETSRTEFTWLPGGSTDIAAYIIYSFSNGDGQALDTVWDPSATSHVISNTAPKYSSVSYVVAAHRLSVVPGLPGCTSPLSNVISTIFCEAKADTCNRRINISWNSYPSAPKEVTGYSVMLSFNGAAFTEAVRTGPEGLNYAVENFVSDADYCFYISAVLDDGTVSSSNKSCVFTGMLRPPDWINADYATVNSENKISLSFTIDPLSQINSYMLERKTGEEGVFANIAMLHSSGGVAGYTDNQASPAVINYYRLSAMNSCDIPITVSNTASNIVLTLEEQGSNFNFTWNPYSEWLGSIAEYRLFVNTGSGFAERTVLNGENNSYKLDYKEIMFDVTSTEVCFFVTAAESGNPHSVSGESNSQVICTSPVEQVTVPNIFTPNNDLLNDYFRPVLSFTPRSYHLIVSDRHGRVLFETRDYAGSWDGTSGGTPVPDDVYIWFLRAQTASGKDISRNGTLTVLRQP